MPKRTSNEEVREVEYLYYIEKKSLREIAKEIKVSTQTVENRLRKSKTYQEQGLRSKSEAKLNALEKSPKTDLTEANIAFDLYMGEDAQGNKFGEPMEIPEIAAKTGRTENFIFNELLKLEEFRVFYFHHLYEDEEMDISEIAAKIKRSDKFVHDALVKHPEYKPRTLLESRRLNKSQEDLDFENLIVEDYLEGMGRPSIQKKYKDHPYVVEKGWKWSDNHVLRILERHKVKIRTVKEAKEIQHSRRNRGKTK